MKVKINILLPSIGKSGGIDVVYKYAEMFQKNGDEVRIYKSIVSPNFHRYPNKIINSLHQIYCSFKTALNLEPHSSMDEFVPVFKDKYIRDADITIATSWPTSYSLNQLSNSKGKKFYFIQDFEVWDNYELGINSYKLPLHKITISKWIASKLQNYCDISNVPIVYNGLDIVKYQRTDKPRDKSHFTVLMLNHKLPKKGVADGVKAFEITMNKYPNCKLVMFGNCDSSNLPGYVEYFHNPTTKQILDLYSTADCFLFPSLEEGWGLTPLEAMACGCPVVGTNTGFVLDLGINQKNMLISQPNDIEGLANNIIRLIDDENLRINIIDGGYKTVSQLDWQNSFQKLRDILISKLNVF